MVRRSKRQASTWVQALKMYNSQHGMGVWVVPRKGTTEYREVKAIQERLK
jgi:hypothetical protein